MKKFLKKYLILFFFLMFANSAQAITVPIKIHNIIQSVKTQSESNSDFNKGLEIIVSAINELSEFLKTSELRTLDQRYSFSERFFDPILEELENISKYPKDNSCSVLLLNLKTNVSLLGQFFQREIVGYKKKSEQYGKEFGRFIKKVEKFYYKIADEVGLVSASKKVSAENVSTIDLVNSLISRIDNEVLKNILIELSRWLPMRNEERAMQEQLEQISALLTRLNEQELAKLKLENESFEQLCSMLQNLLSDSNK